MNGQRDDLVGDASSSGTTDDRTPRRVIGLGTGRSGTVSLSKLLDQQPDADVTHEVLPLLPWNVNDTAIANKIEQLDERAGTLCGDVAFYYLPYVRQLADAWPEVRFVCMRRDKDATVESWIKKTRNDNLWADHDGSKWTKNEVWDHTMPSYEAMPKRDAIVRYWEEYYAEAEILVDELPDRFRIFDLETSFNSPEGLREILDFVGVERTNQVVPQRVHSNPGRRSWAYRGPKKADLPLVSVVIPFYRDRDFIADCLTSITRQNRSKWEIVTVDDGGNDGSVEVVRELAASDPRIRLIRHHENQGLAASRNTGVAFAKGELVTFLDADDFLFPTSLLNRTRPLLELNESDPKIVGTYCGWEMVPEDADLTFQPTARAKQRHLSYLNVAGENPLIATAPLLWRSAVIDVGGFDESFPTAEDFEFWIRLLRQGYELIPTGRVGVAYRQKQSSMISDGLVDHAKHASRIYDYIHRPLHPNEVSAAAPAPLWRPFAEQQRLAGWLRRIALFITLAEGAGDSAERDGLLSMIPDGTSVDDLTTSHVARSIAAGVKRFELRHGELAEEAREDLRQRAYDIMVTAALPAGSFTSTEAPTPSLLRFDEVALRSRAIEETVSSSDS